MKGDMLHILVLLFSIVCFAFAAWQHTSPGWNRIVAIGLAFFAISFIL